MPISQDLDGNWPKDEKERVKLKELIPMFWTESKRLLCNRKLCGPRTFVSFTLDIAHDSRSGGQLKFTNTLSKTIKYP